MAQEYSQIIGDEWVSFPGGELEGKRPKVLCEACREALARETSLRVRRLRRTATSRASSPSRLLCFQCYRAGLDRDRAIRAAGQLNTASEERFQSQLPFEPVDKPRLDLLKADRAEARAAAVLGAGRFVDKRRTAQIAARHALQTIAAGLRAHPLSATDRDREMAMAIRAAELQLPDAWLPFVVAR